MFREYEMEAARVVAFLLAQSEKYRSIGLPDEADALRRAMEMIEDGRHREGVA